MRAYLASSIAVTCAAALAVPLALTTPAGAAAAPAAPRVHPAAPAEPAGSTQSFPLEPLARPAPLDAPRGRALTRPAAPAGERGLARRDVRPFSLVGVVWNDARTPLHGTVQVRTRATADGTWTGWQDVETHNEEHGADPGTAEGRSRALRGATAPLWVGDSDGVEVRVRPEAGPERTAEAAALPAGLRLELVDPGPDPATARAADPVSDPVSERPADPAVDPAAGAPRTRAAAVGGSTGLAPSDATVLPALTRAETLAELPAANRAARAAKPYIGPRPKIITRKGWGADERLREKAFGYTKSVKAAFVHHSATGNNYSCKQAPSVLRSIYRYHVKSLGWRDFGYNFAVDKCGNIYEGRAGGVAKPVLGAHTLGFNTNSMGVVVLGTFGSTTPPAAVVTAVAKLTAWKLGLYGVNPKGKVTLTSGGGNLYKKGRKVKFNAIAGHRDGFATECPGGRLYNKLGTARSSSAKYQGRR
ncbi:N-acetylmuramoyl-L-alanine amidase [Streptomyces sp. NPDC015232]|uniref:peptidoglycan recognition protein family protein n=1 Tax=unclassified Streptomyces TaxID=2593676 RepID=UPI0036F79F3C